MSTRGGLMLDETPMHAARTAELAARLDEVVRAFAGQLKHVEEILRLLDDRLLRLEGRRFC